MSKSQFTPQQVARIFEMVADDTSMFGIAGDLGLPQVQIEQFLTGFARGFASGTLEIPDFGPSEAVKTDVRKAFSDFQANNLTTLAIMYGLKRVQIEAILAEKEG